MIALLAAIRGGGLLPSPSFWQLTQIRKAVARGERTALVCHEDVLVFRKPVGTRATYPMGMAATYPDGTPEVVRLEGLACN